MHAHERVRLGRTPIWVTRLSVGTAPIGDHRPPVRVRDARATLLGAYDAGVRYFDTAPLYGLGSAERRLGELVRRAPRAELVISTKVGRLLRPREGGSHRPARTAKPVVEPVFDFSFDGALRSLDGSLARLGVDHVDVVMIHDPDDYLAEAIAGAYRALARLRCEGVVKALGVGMNRADKLAWMARAGDFDCLLLAGRYTLLDQSALDDLLPVCESRAIPLIAAGVFNSGVLAGPRAGATFDYTPAPPSVLRRAREIAAVGRTYGVPLRAAALQFPLAHPAVATALVGVKSREEVEHDVSMLSVHIPGEFWADLRARGFIRAEAPID